MKLKKKSGFTLIEMLIVVAIIAVLVAVSIPMVNSSLERARVSTDAANERAAKAEALLCYLNGTIDGTTLTSATASANQFHTNTVYVYDAASGSLKPAAQASTVKGYGRCTEAHGLTNTGGKGHQGMVLYVRVDGTTNQVSMAWDTTANYNSTTATNNNVHGITVDD